MKYNLISDVLAFVGVYIVLGGTLTALFAASIMGIMVSALLAIAKNPNDYLYLYDLKNFLSDKMAQAQHSLNEYGRIYREKKLAEQVH